MKLSNRDRAMVMAHEDGYVIIGNEVISPHTNKALRLSLNPNGYPKFTYRFKGERSKSTVRVHRLVAYQKYGTRLFEDDTEPRHLDGDKLNFRLENIAIGTHSQNMMDIPILQDGDERIQYYF